MTPRWDVPPGSGFVFAHRGASALAPENSIEAFLLAAELGAPGVELDVQLTRDGVPAVVHDPFVLQDADGAAVLRAEGGGLRRRWLRELDWEEVAALEVRHPDGRLAPIARLEEVIEAVPAQLWLDIELKAGALYDPRLAGVVLGCLSRRREQVLLCSFDHQILHEVAAIDPELPLLTILHARPVELSVVVEQIPSVMVSMDWPFLTAGDAARWREAGYVVMVGGPQVAEQLAAAASWPVDAVFLDDPRALAAHDDERARQPAS